MMTIASYKLFGYDEDTRNKDIRLEVPSNAQSLEAVSLPDGVYLYYGVEIDAVKDTKTDTFRVLTQEGKIPSDSRLVNIVSVAIAGEGGEEGQTVLMVMPIFQIFPENHGF